MNRHSRSYHRLGSRYFSAVVGWFAVGLSGIAALLLFSLMLRTDHVRTTIVVAGDPVHIVSFDADKSRILAFDLPHDTVIGATDGYGRYRLDSLFTLDHLDKRHGSVYVTSVADAIGMPLVGYVAPKQDGSEPVSLAALRGIFSWQSIIGVLTGRIDHSLSVPEWLAMVWSVQRLKADAVSIMDVHNAVVSQQEADGSTTKFLDVERLDYYTKAEFVDTAIRNESLTVTITNTTGVPLLGQRMARLLGSIGIQVVSVGNEEQPVKRCQLTVSKNAVKSETAVFMASYFHCDTTTLPEKADNGVSDMTLKIGTDFASHYEVKTE
jgi:hypothetical protein